MRWGGGDGRQRHVGDLIDESQSVQLAHANRRDVGARWDSRMEVAIRRQHRRRFRPCDRATASGQVVEAPVSQCADADDGREAKDARAPEARLTMAFSTRCPVDQRTQSHGRVNPSRNNASPASRGDAATFALERSACAVCPGAPKAGTSITAPVRPENPDTALSNVT